MEYTSTTTTRVKDPKLIDDVEISVSDGELTTTSTVQCDPVYAEFTRVDEFEPPELTFAWSIDDGEYSVIPNL